MFRRKGSKPENSKDEEQVEVLIEDEVDPETLSGAEEEEVLVAPEAVAAEGQEANAEVVAGEDELDEAELEELEIAVEQEVEENSDPAAVEAEVTEVTSVVEEDTAAENTAGEDVDLTQESVDVAAAQEVDAATAEDAADKKEDEEDIAATPAEAFLGFQDTVSLSTESYPATKPSVLEEVAEETVTTDGVADEVTEDSVEETAEEVPSEDDSELDLEDVEDEETAADGDTTEEDPEETQDTAVLRRSLLETPEETEAAYPSRRAHRLSEDGEDPLDEGLGVLAGGTVLPTLPSRAGARWLSAIGTILLTPVMWYLLADSGARLAFADGNPMATGVINPAALMELVAGLLIVVLVAMLAAQSSIGLILAGILVAAIGIPFLVAPTWTESSFGYLTGLEEFNAFGSNVVAHLGFTGFTGILVISGFVMIAAGWVIASVRRQGRTEEATRVEVAMSNPEGLKARWARKATEKDE